MTKLIELWTQLHFLRPYWLLALLLVPALAVIHLWRKRQEHWQQAIDPHLLIHLLEGGKSYKRTAQIIKLCVLVLAILALAGPSWQKIEHALLEPKADPLVIVLDLSSAIMTPDLPPSRLVQARAKLKRLLEQRQGGEVALVVYANDAFTVTPLTDDGANVILFLDALAPEIMPQDGQRADRALKWAKDLLQQSGAAQGDILLLTNQANTSARRQAADIHKAGYRLSVLALGSAQGGTYRTRNGRVVHSERDSDALNTLASAGGGHYQVLTTNDDDLHALGVLEPQAHLAANVESAGRNVQLWQDQGYWLLWPLLLLMLPAFRQLSHRASVLLLCLSFPWAAELYAEESGSLWQRSDQIQHRQLAEGVQAYREGAYARAQQLFSGNENAEAWYNQGNALARQGRYEQAIAAYDRALEQQPDMEDAIANRAIVEAARQQQEQQSTHAQDDSEANSTSKDSENAEESESNAQSEQENSSASSENQSQEDSNEEESSDQQNSEPSSSDNPSSNGEENESTQSTESSSSSKNQNQEGADESESKASAPSDSGQSGSSDSSEDQNLDAEDSANQQQANAALQEQMNQALQQTQPANSNSNPTSSAQTSSTPLNPQQQHELEQQQALEAWLQRIPDDPGALLRAKFQIEHQRRSREGR